MVREKNDQRGRRHIRRISGAEHARYFLRPLDGLPVCKNCPNLSGGKGRLNRSPGNASQPCEHKNSCCRSVSTPSAMALSPMPCPSAMRVLAMVAPVTGNRCRSRQVKNAPFVFQLGLTAKDKWRVPGCPSQRLSRQQAVSRTQRPGGTIKPVSCLSAMNSAGGTSSFPDPAPLPCPQPGSGRQCPCEEGVRCVETRAVCLGNQRSKRALALAWLALLAIKMGIFLQRPTGYGRL